jgi:hypothetical protein
VRRARNKQTATHLLHDAGLALGKGNVPARLVLDELDLNLAALAAGLVIIVVVVVGSLARAFGAAVRVANVEGAIAVVVQRGRRVLVVVGDFRGHGGGGVGRQWCLGVALTAYGVCGEASLNGQSRFAAARYKKRVGAKPKETGALGLKWKEGWGGAL